MYYLGSFKNGVKSIYVYPFKTLEGALEHCKSYGSYYIDIFKGESATNSKVYCSIKNAKRIVKLKKL